MGRLPTHSIPDPAGKVPQGPRPSRGLLKAALALGAGAAAYMMFEAQWIDCRERALRVPDLPHGWSDVRVLHLADVHAGEFALNLISLRKAVSWAAPLEPDLVFLTGDILGDPARSSEVLAELARLRPALGSYAVTGNHEYGLGKGPLARARDTANLWAETGVTLLRDTCVRLPARNGSSLMLCGADHLTGGFGLAEQPVHTGSRAAGDFPILLIHEAPASGDPLERLFPLAFSGHTHGGQLRVPGRSGLGPLAEEHGTFLGGVHRWGGGLMVVSRGVGTSFLPFRLLTRPEATLWRLV